MADVMVSPGRYGAAGHMLGAARPHSTIFIRVLDGGAPQSHVNRGWRRAVAPATLKAEWV